MGLDRGTYNSQEPWPMPFCTQSFIFNLLSFVSRELRLNYNQVQLNFGPMMRKRTVIFFWVPVAP